MECNLKANRKNCTCTYEPCARKGRCCECVAYHRQHGEIPGCFFSPEAERTHDRSIDRLITSMRKK
ncbi:MAG: DUF6485 family protein [candidate division WOR-3 bacterium]